MEIQKMNKRGNIWMGIGIGLFIWIFGILFLSFFLDDITQARVDLQCANPSAITGGTMILCLGLDGIVPYIIWTIASVSLGYFFGRGT